MRSVLELLHETHFGPPSDLAFSARASHIGGMAMESGLDWHGFDWRALAETCDALAVGVRPHLRYVLGLGEMPYRDYLRSVHWQDVREFALRRAENACQVCGTPRRLQVHHRTYERRGRENIADVLVLCSGCHGLFHERGRLA